MAPQSFPIIVDMSEAQKKTMRDLNVIVNQLGFRVIEIEQLNPRVREVTGVQVCRYKELPQIEIDQMQQRMGTSPTAQELYPYDVDGGTIVFAESPFPRQMSPGSTGRVAFVLDDDMDTPEYAYSGEKKGWNREFLASHYNDGFWKIVDPDIDREVRARAEAIAKRREEMKLGKYRPGLAMPNQRRDPSLISRPDPGVSVPSSIKAENETAGFGDGTISASVSATGLIALEPGATIALDDGQQKLIEEQRQTIELLKGRLEALENAKPPLKGKKITKGPKEAGFGA
jgi:hypothetical protein